MICEPWAAAQRLSIKITELNKTKIDEQKNDGVNFTKLRLYNIISKLGEKQSCMY